MSPFRHSARRPMQEHSRRTIHLVIAWQLGVTIGIAAVLAVTRSGNLAYSALVGGLIGVVPGYFLARRMLRLRRGATAIETLRDIYTGEFVKIAFTAALFVFAILLLNANFLVVVATYLATVAVNWGALLVVNLGDTGERASTGQPTG